jgi:hypothetical protein
VANLELRHTITPERIGRESRFTNDLAPVSRTPANILPPLRVPNRFAEKCRIHPGGINGEHAVRCDKLSGETHKKAQLLALHKEREEIAASNDEPRAPLEALRWKPVQEVNLKEFRRWNAFPRQRDRLRVTIETDQAAITNL